MPAPSCARPWCCRRPDVVADAELVITELVTNAQLHGAGPIAVRASWVEPCVLVEVQDHGRHMPVLPVQSTDAMTGRGLALVAALSSAWGVRPVPDGPGKVVWAELGGTADTGAPELDVEALLASWHDEGPDEPTFTVRLGSVPTDLLLDAKRHIDNVVRELTLERVGSAADSLAPGFRALIETVTSDFAVARTAIKRQAVEAAARGDDETDLVLTLPASAADAGERYLAALDGGRPVLAGRTAADAGVPAAAPDVPHLVRAVPWSTSCGRERPATTSRAPGRSSASCPTRSPRCRRCG